MANEMPATEPGAAENPSAEGADKARRYNQLRFRIGLLSGATEIALLLLLAVSGLSRWIERRWAQPAVHGPTIVVLIYVVIVGVGFQAVALGFSLWHRRVEVRYGFNRQGWTGWWADRAKGAALGGGLGLLGAEMVYALLRAHPASWWLWAWAAYAAFSVVMVRLSPLLLRWFYEFRPLSPDVAHERELMERLRALHARLDAKAAASGRRLPALHGIYEWKLGAKTSKANAALTGWGASRQVILSDTLLADAPIDEIEAIFAHEMGHHVHRDIWRGLAAQCALSLAVATVAALILRAAAQRLQLAGVADVAGLPLLLLVTALSGLAAMPAINGFSRWMERRADEYSFAALETATPLMHGLERLARTNLAEVNPPRWKEWLLYSHPSIGTRLRRGRQWMSH